MKKENKGLYNFNKEIIISQIGSMVGAPLLSKIVSLSTKNLSMISGGAVIGGMIGGGLTWVITRLKDKVGDKNYTKKKLMKDIVYIIPGDIAASWLLYQPVVFFLSRYLLTIKMAIIPSVIIAQIVGFIIYLTVLDEYRGWLRKKFNKEL